MALFGTTDLKPPTQTVQQTLSPGAQQIQDAALPGVLDFANKPLQMYPGQTYAGFDPLQTQAQEMALGAAPTQATTAGQAAGTYGRLTGDLTSASNPMLRAAQDAAVRPIYENLTEKALPAARSGAIEAGGFGGTRQGLVEQGAIRDAGRLAGDTSAKLAQDVYQTNLQTQLSALGLTPTVQGAQTVPAQTVGAVGDVRQAQTQQGIDEAMKRYDFANYGDYLKSRDLLGLSTGLGGGTVTATGSIAPGPSKGQQALGGALSGAAAGSVFGPMGTVVGGGVGALTPFVFG